MKALKWPVNGSSDILSNEFWRGSFNPLQYTDMFSLQLFSLAEFS